MYQPTELSMKQVLQCPDVNPEEGRAMQYFRDVVAERLGGSFDASFWTRVAPQAAQTVAPVRHAMASLGSLWEHGCTIEQSNTFALRQYVRAISEVRRTMQGSYRPEEILLTNILFTCIEIFQGHHESALSQLSSGLYIFCGWQAQKGLQNSSSTKQLAIVGNEFETHLMRVFRRLMMQQLLVPITYLLDRRLLIPAFTHSMPTVPLTFTSVDEARDVFCDCVSAMLHDSISALCNGSMERDEGRVRPMFSLDEYTLKRWQRAFDNFRKSAGEGLSSKEERACISLEMHYIVMSILMSVIPQRSEEAFDACESQFSRLVDLAPSVAESIDCTSSLPGGMKGYPDFDMGFVPPLYFVASRCRHPEIRRQAIKLLRQVPHQEGIWNSTMLVNLCERMMVIEESRCDNVKRAADVPLSARVKVVDTTLQSRSRTLTAILQRELHNDAGDVEVLHEELLY